MGKPVPTGGNKMSELKTTDLSKHYGVNAEVKAIDGVDFAVESGELSGV